MLKVGRFSDQNLYHIAKIILFKSKFPITADKCNCIPLGQNSGGTGLIQNKKTLF